MGTASAGTAAGGAAVAAVDLGASGGRVMVGQVGHGQLDLHEAHRFANTPVRVLGTLHWDILGLYRGMLDGLGAAARAFGLASVGIDSWGVDYGLLDATGALIGNPVHYRDSRTDGVTVPVPAETLYAATGIQHLPINTIYQLAAAAGTPALSAAETLLLIPDLLAYWLTGSVGAEVTNASTTGLLDVTTRTWAVGLIEQAGIPAGIFPPLRSPGDPIGPITAGQSRVGPGGAGRAGALIGANGEPVPLIAVGSHDTASAVVAVPASGPHFAYISSGTWSLVGLELDAPVLTEESRLANFTNEGGVDGTIRYLRNVTGLWLLQECMRQWRLQGSAYTWTGLLRLTEKSKPFRSLISPDSPDFVAPNNMLLAIRNFCQRTKQPTPDTAGDFARCCIESLSLRYRQVLDSLLALIRRPLSIIRVAGGGSLNRLLCQFTANATNRSVITGPTEGSVLGNALTQAMATGHIKNLQEGREIIASSIKQSVFRPQAIEIWEETFQRFQKLSATSVLASSESSR